MPDELLICDVLRKNTQTQMLAPDIDVTRRQAFIFAQGDAVEIVSGVRSVLAPAVDTVRAALDEVLDAFEHDHYRGTPEQVPTTEPPAAVMDKWFKDGLKLPPPPFQDESGRSEPK